MTPKKRLKIAIVLVIAILAWFATGQMRANARLRAALSSQDDEAIRAAIASGADPYAPRALTMRKSMVFVAMMGDNSVLPLLLPNGLDLKKLGDDVREPFLRATVGDVAVVKLFLEAGMSPNVDSAKAYPVGQSSREPSLLMRAAQNGQLEMVRLLLKHGAVANYQQRAGPDLISTPLLAAAQKDRYEFMVGHSEEERRALMPLENSSLTQKQKPPAQIVQMLLEAGADPAVKDHLGHDALFYARAAKDHQSVKSLTDWQKRKQK